MTMFHTRGKILKKLLEEKPSKITKPILVGFKDNAKSSGKICMSVIENK